MSSDLTPAQHDDIVRTQALQLLAQGFDVRARIEGWFELPDFIAGYRPDIVAKKDEHFIIVEVEKGEIDWPKVSAFELFVRNRPNFEFRTIPAWREPARKTGT